MMRILMRPVLLAVLLTVSTMLAGCSDGYDPCRPRTYSDRQPLSVPAGAPAEDTEAGGGAHRLTVTVHDETLDGPAVPGAGIVVWRTTERTETVGCSEEEERTDTYQSTGPVARARTGADGVAVLHVDEGGVLGLVVGDAPGHLGRALGDPLAAPDGRIDVALLRANKTLVLEDALSLGLPARVEGDENLGAPGATARHEVRLHPDGGVHAEYLSLLDSLESRLSWTNGLESAATLTLAYLHMPDDSTLARSPDETLPSAPTPGARSLDLALEDEALQSVRDEALRGGLVEAEVDWDDAAWALTDPAYRLVVDLDFRDPETYAAYPLLGRL